MAIAGVGFGAAFLWQSEPDVNGAINDSKVGGYTEFKGTLDTASDRALAADILYGIAGGLAVTSVVLYFVEGRMRTNKNIDDKKDRLKMGFMLGNNNGFVFNGRF